MSSPRFFDSVAFAFQNFPVPENGNFDKFFHRVFLHDVLSFEKQKLLGALAKWVEKKPFYACTFNVCVGWGGA